MIGVNSQIATGSADDHSNAGIGFAVPINTAKEVIPMLEKDGRVRRAYLGIKCRTVDASLRALGEQAAYGVLVAQVVPGSPAARIGLVADSGDGQRRTATSSRRSTAAGCARPRTSCTRCTPAGRGTRSRSSSSAGPTRQTVQVRLAERPAQLMVD